MSEYLEEQMNEDARKDWSDKMKEPLRAFDLAPEEIEELKKQGRI